MTNAFLTSHAVAELIGVSPSTVLSWIDKGLLPAFRTPGGHRRVEPSALLEFLRAHQMPVPRTLLPQAKRMLLIDDDIVFLRSTKRALKPPPDPALEKTSEDKDGEGGAFTPQSPRKLEKRRWAGAVTLA